MRDIITNIYRILLELLHDVRHRALVYALEPVEVVGLAVACAFFFVCGRGGGVLCGRGDGVGVARRAVVWHVRKKLLDAGAIPAPFCSMRSAQAK